jgi:hypothetical protein
MVQQSLTWGWVSHTGSTLMWGVVVQLLYWCCTRIKFLPSHGVGRKMLDLQHQYNNCTTIPHMRVGPTYWGPPSCEGLLYSCCIDIVQESNPGVGLSVWGPPHVRRCCAIVIPVKYRDQTPIIWTFYKVYQTPILNSLKSSLLLVCISFLFFLFYK